MEEIKDFLDYSITLLSFDNKLNEKHLTDFKNNIVRPILAYLGNSSIDIGVIPQIGNEDLFYDYLRHFNLELQWSAITDSQEGISSLKNDIESEFRTFWMDFSLRTMIAALFNWQLANSFIACLRAQFSYHFSDIVVSY